MIDEVFIDLDDTLNSLTLHILGTTCGLDIGIYDYDRFPVEVGYDIIAAYEKLKPQDHPDFPAYSVKDFWTRVSRSIWSKTPKAPQYDFLMESVESLVGRDNICLLTTPTKDPECVAGKLEWIQEYLPEWMHRQYFIGPRKKFCAHPGALLIDDSDENVNVFRAKGGHAILVPRPWNTNHLYDTDAYLYAKFADLLETA